MPMKYATIYLLLIFLAVCGCSRRESAVETSIRSTAEGMSASTAQTSIAGRSVNLLVGGDQLRFTLADLGVDGDADEWQMDQEAFAAFCEQLNAKYGKPAKDAQMTFSEDPAEPLTILAEEDGVAIDAKALQASIAASTDGEDIPVHLQPVKADVTAQSLKERYSLLSTYTTSFKGSTLGRKNRVSNMALAVSRINGVVVEPGEEFSMNETILDRTKENGYSLAPAIRNGTYEKEYGGGVCQVSSTLFNAVMMADLPVTERHHHSWPMTYVPIGRDATISTGYKDFKFVNATAEELIIFAHLDQKAKTVTVRLYGTHSPDFDHIEIESKRTGSLPAKGTKLKLDESLPAGSRVEERKERRGRTSVTYKKYYDAEGTLIRQETAYEDTYPSIEGLIYVSADIYR